MARARAVGTVVLTIGLFFGLPVLAQKGRAEIVWDGLYPVLPAGTILEYADGLVVTVISTAADGRVVLHNQYPGGREDRITYAYGLEWESEAHFYDGQLDEEFDYVFDDSVVAGAWPLTPGYGGRYHFAEDNGEHPADVMLKVIGEPAGDIPAGPADTILVRQVFTYGLNDFGEAHVLVLDSFFRPEIGIAVETRATSFFDGTPEEPMNSGPAEITLPRL